jgi:sulfite exporter TauE/SafE
MTDDEKDITTDNETRHTTSGIVSVVLTTLALIMLTIIRPLGITPKGEEGFDLTFVLYLFFCMTVAIVGGFFGAMGITEENAKKTLPAIGLTLAAIFVILIGLIIYTSVSSGITE